MTRVSGLLGRNDISIQFNIFLFVSVFSVEISVEALPARNKNPAERSLGLFVQNRVIRRAVQK